MFQIATKREKGKLSLSQTSNCQILFKAGIYYGKDGKKNDGIKKKPVDSLFTYRR